MFDGQDNPKKRRKEKTAKAATKLSGCHIRRCHICGGVTEAEQEKVHHCAHCGKSMAPFYFFEDEKVEPLSDVELRPPQEIGCRVPVRGLTAYW